MSKLILAAEKNNADEDIYLNELFESIMTAKIKEPKEDYLSDPIYKTVRKASAREMEKRRKLGLPIIMSRSGKIIDLNPQQGKNTSREKKGLITTINPNYFFQFKPRLKIIFRFTIWITGGFAKLILHKMLNVT